MCDQTPVWPTALPKRDVGEEERQHIVATILHSIISTAGKRSPLLMLDLAPAEAYGVQHGVCKLRIHTIPDC